MQPLEKLMALIERLSSMVTHPLLRQFPFVNSEGCIVGL